MSPSRPVWAVAILILGFFALLAGKGDLVRMRRPAAGGWAGDAAASSAELAFTPPPLAQPAAAQSAPVEPTASVSRNEPQSPVRALALPTTARTRRDDGPGAPDRRIAIATTAWLRTYNLEGLGQVCGIIKWCEDAVRFAELLGAERARSDADGKHAWPWGVDVVVSTNDVVFVRAHCPQPSVRIERIEPWLLELIHTWVTTSHDEAADRQRVRDAGGKWHLGEITFNTANLAKWHVFGLARYELVFQIDIDVDLLHAGSYHKDGPDAYVAGAVAAWRHELPRFFASEKLMLASADFESPANGGVLIFKPSRQLFEEGVALMRSSRWSIELGFNYSGRPRDLMPPELLAVESVNRSRMVALNSWNIVCGASDQGLVVLLFAMRHRGLQLSRRSDYVVHHFWASSKPWVRTPSCAPYFHALGLLDSVGDVRPGRAPEPKLLHGNTPTLAHLLPVSLPAGPASRRGRQSPKAQTPEAEGVCWQYLRTKTAELLRGERWRWRCRGTTVQVF